MTAGAAGQRSFVPGGQGGYAMAALLVAISVMMVIMSMAMPVWSTAAKRAREDELVFRGEQYARAIGMYQRKYANALPPSIDVLVNERFLRKKYLDPITGGEFQPLTGAAGQAVPGMGGPGRGGIQPGAALPQAAPTPSGIGGARGLPPGGAVAGQPGPGPFGASVGGGIIGVASKSKESSLRVYNGRSAYNEWTFVAVQRSLQAGTGADGAQTPGGGPGRGGRAGERGIGPGSGPGRPGGTGPGSFRPPAGDSFRPPGDGRGFRPGGGR